MMTELPAHRLSTGPVELTAADQAFLDSVTAADAIPPISDGVLATTAAEARLVRLHLLSSAEPELAGLGIVTELGDRWAAEFTIAPSQRGRGLGRALFTQLQEQAAQPAWFWSHGDFPAAATLAAEAGLVRARELLQMITGPQLSAASLPPVTAPAGVQIRSFHPGDEAGWRDVNNAAFDWHPEQGKQSLADIEAITQAPDFDPDSVIIAQRDGHVVGFHHTKMHHDHPAGHAIGEVYVIGVDPRVHAAGIGRALTIAGLHYLFAAGASAVELYVEADNEPALKLYRALGFEVNVVHVSYAPADQADAHGQVRAGEDDQDV